MDHPGRCLLLCGFAHRLQRVLRQVRSRSGGRRARFLAGAGQIAHRDLYAYGVWLLLWFLLVLPPLLALIPESQSLKQAANTTTKRLRQIFDFAWERAILVLVVGLGLVLSGDIAHELWVNSGTPSKLKFLAWLPAAGLFVIVGLRTSGQTPLRRAWEWLERNGAAIFGIVVAAVVISASWTAYHAVRSLSVRYANKAFHGISVSTVNIDLPSWFPDPRAFDIRAEAAYVRWEKGPPNDVGAEDCLLFLGSSGGISFLFDVQTHETLRVSPAAVGTGSARDRMYCGKSSGKKEPKATGSGR